MPKLPDRSWSRKRNPETCPSTFRECPLHGYTEHRRYVLVDQISIRCVACKREKERISYANRKAGVLPSWHPLQEEVDILAPANPICPKCFLETANNGTCGCE